MRVMLLEQPGQPLRAAERDLPVPGPREVLLRVRACGVCRTDLHIRDGELSEPTLPLVPGHEIVGEVARVGEEVNGLAVGQRLGVPWLGSTCGVCRFCRAGAENLCDRPTFTGYTRDGGYADFAVADSRFCLPIPDEYGDAEAAPLLCAGLIGYRAYRMAGRAERLGLYGFGAAAHILAQIAHHQGREVYAFTRPGDRQGAAFARRLGAVWAGGSDQTPPVELDAAILFAPVGALVPAALAAVRKGGTVVCAGIHMSDIPSFPYELLWGERTVRSVANLTREDGLELFRVAPRVPVRTSVRTFPLERAEEALEALRGGELQGAAVLETGSMRLELDGGYRIRSHRAGDKPALLAYADNRNVSRYLRDRFPYPYTPEVADRWLEHVAAEEPQTSFAIATAGELIGGIGVELGEDIHHRSGEIGFWLGEPFWGRGIVTAAVIAFTPWAFERFDLLRIWAGVFDANPASARVLEKAGYAFEGRLRRAVVKGGRVLDELVFARLGAVP